MDDDREETHVVSVLNLPLETVAELRDEKDDRPLPHQIRRPRLTARKKNLQNNQATEMKDKRSKIPCRYRSCNNLSCGYWHLPVCQNYRCNTGCTFCDKCRFRHVEAEEKPSKKSKKGGAKGSVALLKESFQVGCVSQDSHPRKSIPRKEGRLASNRTVKFSKGAWHHIKIREKWSAQLCVNFTSAIRALPDLKKGHQTKPYNKKDAPAQKHGELAKNVHKLENYGYIFVLFFH